MQSLLLGKGCHHENALPALISLLSEVVINPARFLVSNVIMFFPFPPVWWTSLHWIVQSPSLFFTWCPYSKGLHDSEAQFLILGVPYGVPSLGGSLITPVTWAQSCSNNWENAVMQCKENTVTVKYCPVPMRLVTLPWKTGKTMKIKRKPDKKKTLKIAPI